MICGVPPFKHSHTVYSSFFCQLLANTKLFYTPFLWVHTLTLLCLLPNVPLVSESARVPSQSVWELPAAMASRPGWVGGGCMWCMFHQAEWAVSYLPQRDWKAWAGGKGKEGRAGVWQEGRRRGGKKRRRLNGSCNEVWWILRLCQLPH